MTTPCPCPLLVVFLIACSAPTRVPEQPIAFDHARHLRLDLDGRKLRCTDCHAGAERAEHAGLPALRDCLRCHVRPQTADQPFAPPFGGAARSGEAGPFDPRDARVRALAVPGHDFRWTQVTRNPGHVYAPHRAHVGIAKLACEECHGDTTRWTAPPTEPIERLRRMSECISCHRNRGAPTTCGTCHR